MAASRCSRIAPLLMIFACSSLLGPGVARAAWRSTAAPADLASLLAYASFQPPEGEGDLPDTNRPPEPKEGQGTPTTPNSNPFERADSSRGSTSTIPLPGANPAALETLGASSTFRSPQAAPTPLPVGPRPRRGVLGIHPLALLVGLVALHIFIVTTVIR